MKQIGDRFFSAVSISSIAFFRIFFGLIMLWEVTRYFQKGWISRYFIEPAFYFSYDGFGWMQPWPGNGMYLHFALLGVLALFITIGFCYRVSSLLFFLGFTYVFLLDKTNYLNHFYLISLLSLLLAFIPAHKNYSVDAYLRPAMRSDTVPYWSLWLLKFQISIVYIYGGIAKINADWLSGEPMRMWLANRSDFFLIGPYFTLDWMPYLFSYGGLLLDLLIVPFLLIQRTRIYAVILITAFHLMNAYLFKIGIFPWFMIGASTLFFRADWCKGVLSKFQLRHRQQPHTRYRALIAGGIAVFVLWQVLFPLRHFLYEGNVSWTEEGHRFSWHMKLRSKSANARFYVKDHASNALSPVDVRAFLSSRQRSKMPSRPDMILQFAHHLEDVYAEAGALDVEIYASVKASLNNRTLQVLISPETNLAAIKSYETPANWIEPLKY